MSVPDEFDAYAGKLEDNSKARYQQELKAFVKHLPEYWEFKIVPGFFKQALAETDASKFNYLTEDFGRIHSWEDTFQKLDELNSKAPEDTKYKIMFLARHGQGYHNLANAVYGQKAWDEKWSKLNGDGKMVWGPDPDLTELGVQQAKDNAHVWGEQLAKGCKLPTRWLASPFTRSIDTLIHTWNKHVSLEKVEPFIKEDLRETIGVHTCDMRSPKSVIAQKTEPHGFVIEPGFEEEDVYFKYDYRESIEEQSIRINRAFQYIFDTYEDDVISITSHSGTIRSQLLVLDHREFSIGTGGMIPVFIEAKKVRNT